MSTNGKALPFQAPAGTPIVGQPFTVVGVMIPVNAQIRCNCGGENVLVTIMNSQPTPCPSCGRSFFAVFNPSNGQIQIGIMAQEQPKEPS